MAKARIFYGSSTGNTQRIASLIKEELGDLIESVTDIAKARPDDLASAQALILGVSTWEDGQLQEDWNDFFPELDGIDLSGTTVALFGLGDAYGFSGEFVNALGTLYRKVRERGATVVGAWPTDGYDFDDSTRGRGRSVRGSRHRRGKRGGPERRARGAVGRHDPVSAGRGLTRARRAGASARAPVRPGRAPRAAPSRSRSAPRGRGRARAGRRSCSCG